ncbi:MAG TPA: hypothetical protein VGI54_08250 [Solirubrobacteraceae bacterium]
MTETQAPDEVRELARRAFDEAGDGVGGIGSIHQAVAGRVFRAVGPWGRPVEVAHQAVTNSVYAGMRGASSLLGRAADVALAQRERPAVRELSTRPAGAAVVGILDGLIGDRLEREGSALQEPMAVRVDGRVVELTRDGVAAAFPGARGRIVVFLHGLMESEYSWRRGADRGVESYATRLARDLGCTPVFVRYNTGRHISENGASLDALLESLAAAWPVKLREIALVGHSMGGLVVRSAGCRADERDARWVRAVRHVVSLGSPHMGAPLAQAVHWASAGLHALPETRPFAAFLRRRSAGIRDLRSGSLVDEDWRDRDPDALRAAASAEIPLLAGVTHCFVAATITRDARHPLGRMIGDTLVLQPSASGRSRTRRLAFRAEHGMHVGGAHHLMLLNHPEIYEKLRLWLSTPPDTVTRPRRLPAPRGRRALPRGSA